MRAFATRCLATALLILLAPPGEGQQPAWRFELVWRCRAGAGVYAAPTVAGNVLYFSSLDHYVYAAKTANGDVLWRSNLGDVVWAGVALGGGLAFTGTAGRAVVALNLKDGHVVWRRAIDGVVYATPVFSEGRVFVGTGDSPTVYALDARNGKPLWTYSMGARLGSGLVVRGGRVYAGSHDKTLHVVDAKSGKLVWRFDAGGIVDSLPLVTADRVYLKLPSDTVHALAVADGKPVWRYDAPQAPIASDAVSNWSNLALAGDRLVFGSCDHKLHALDASTGQAAWSLAGADEFPAAPAIVGRLACVGSKNGSLSAVDVASGAAVAAWENPQPTGDPYLRGIMWPPAIDKAKLYAGSMDGSVYALRLTTEAAPAPPAAAVAPATPVPLPPTAPPAPPVPVTPVPPPPPVPPAPVPAAPPAPPPAGPISLKWLDEEPAGSLKVTFKLPAVEAWPAGGRLEAVLGGPTDRRWACKLDASALRLYRKRRQGPGEELVAAAVAPLRPGGQKVTLSYEPGRVRVLVDGRVWLTGYGDDAAPAKVGLGASAPALAPQEVALQRIEPPWFNDDFMRDKQQQGAWTPLSGTWETSGVSEEYAREDKRPNPNFSSNPFAYRAKEVGGEALAAAGEWFWDTYRFTASVRPGTPQPGATAPAAVGLCLNLGGAGQYLAFEWGRQGQGNERRLVAVEDGKRRVLGQGAGGWRDDQWYRIAVEMTDGRLRAWIDGEPAVSSEFALGAGDGRTAPLRGEGKVGLWAAGVTFADFDDVQVAGAFDVADDFAQPSCGRWVRGSGLWADRVTAGESGVKLLKRGPGEVLTGLPEWENYRVTGRLRAPFGGGFGLVCAWRDEAHGLRLRWGDGAAPAGWRDRLQLVQQESGLTKVLAERRGGFERGRWYALGLENRSGLVRATVDGRPVFEALAATLTQGRAGLLGEGNGVEFDRFGVEFLPRDTELEFGPPVAPQFHEEELMAQWAQPQGSWWTAEERRTDGVLWHRGQFHGDCRVGVGADLFGDAARSIELLVAADGKSAATGYSLHLAQAEPKSRQLDLQLRCRGETVAQAKANLEGAEAVWLDRRGRLLTARTPAGPLLAYTDPRPEPERGLHVGLRWTGPAVDLGRVQAESAQCLDTTFSRAPAEWHVAKGLWETINRWQCDARWSFFGGHRDPQPLIWTKADYSGDIQVEAYLGIQMDLPTTPHYQHPSDLCLSLFGDGRNALSGYSFLFATRNNTCSQLYRQGKLLGENKTEAAKFKYVTAQGEGLKEFHRHWFHLVVRRAGGRLVCSVDDQELFNVPDEQPLPRGKVGLYSVNNGVLVSRVKIWYEEGAPPQAFPDLISLVAGADRGESLDSPFANDFERSLGACAALSPNVLVSRSGVAAQGQFGLQATDLVAGGEFGVTLVSQPFKAAEHPLLRFRYRVPPTARFDLHVKVQGAWQRVRFVGGEGPQLGAIADVHADEQWHAATFDLGEALQKALGTADVTVEQLVLAMRETDPYLQAGLETNLEGTTYYLDELSLGPRPGG